jgi:hypothetical protein
MDNKKQNAVYWSLISNNSKNPGEAILQSYQGVQEKTIPGADEERLSQVEILAEFLESEGKQVVGIGASREEIRPFPL